MQLRTKLKANTTIQFRSKETENFRDALTHSNTSQTIEDSNKSLERANK